MADIQSTVSESANWINQEMIEFDSAFF